MLSTGYYAAGDGGDGVYYLDTDDSTSADNGGTVIVAADGGRWKLIHHGTVSVRQFGARVNSFADDHAFVQAALNSVDHVIFPPGICRITATLVLRSNLLVELTPGSIIDFSSAIGVNFLFFAEGTSLPLPYVPLTMDAESGTRTVEIASTEGFARGDWVKIKADTFFDSHRTRSRIGEINRITEAGPDIVVGDDPIRQTPFLLPLVADLQDTYRADEGAGVAKLTMVENIIIRGGKLLGVGAPDNGQTAIEFRFSLNCRVENMSFDRFDASGVLSRNSIGTTVTGCRFVNARADSNGYGVSFRDATADSIASDNHFDEVRHSLSTNTTPASDHGVVRRILFSNNTVRSSARALNGGGGDAIDTHAAAEDISIIGNTVLSSSGQGINLDCPTAVIIGNTINDTLSNGISAHNESDHNGSVVIANNRIERCAETGIAVSQGNGTERFGATEFAYTEVVVEGNTVEVAERDGILVRTRNNSETLNRAVSIMGNSLRSIGNPMSERTDAGIRVSGIRCGSITGNSLSNVGEFGIRATNIRSVSIGSNSVQMRTGSVRAGISLTTDSGRATRDCAIVGNTIRVTSSALEAPGIELTSEVTHTAVVANILRSTQGVELGSGAGNISANNV